MNPERPLTTRSPHARFKRRPGPVGQLPPPDIAARREQLVNDLINSVAAEVHLEGEALDTEVRPVFLRLQEVVLNARIAIADRKARKNAEETIVLEKADQAILERSGYTGIPFQGFDIPERPATKRQKRQVRKLNDSIDQKRSDVMRRVHFSESLGEEITDDDYMERLESSTVLTRSERRDHANSTRSAKQIEQKIQKNISKREKILSKPRERMETAVRKREILIEKRDTVLRLRGVPEAQPRRDRSREEEIAIVEQEIEDIQAQLAENRRRENDLNDSDS